MQIILSFAQIMMAIISFFLTYGHLSVQKYQQIQYCLMFVLSCTSTSEFLFCFRYLKILIRDRKTLYILIRVIEFSCILCFITISLVLLVKLNKEIVNISSTSDAPIITAIKIATNGSFHSLFVIHFTVICISSIAMTTALLVSLYLINKEIKLQNLAEEQRINKLMFWGNIIMDLCAEVALITLSLNIVVSTSGE